MNEKAIFFDMDGTLADFYGVEGWLECLQNNDPTPYKIAKPLVNVKQITKLLRALKKRGYFIGIISWGSKCGDLAFLKATEKVKKQWLKKYFKKVVFDSIDVIPHGVLKSSVVGEKCKGILFDDDSGVRDSWFKNGGIALTEKNICSVLKTLL